MTWPVPTNGKEVATFLGFAGYYRSFIPQYSALTNRLNGIKKAEKFMWNVSIGLSSRYSEPEGVQENWDLWINASVFAYNSTVLLRSSRITLR